ncbi:MAG: translation initiation factor IF-2 [Candidatus Gastranaerophilales bacterium]
MSFETMRINELAKELGMTSKEVIDKFAQISITCKAHSSTVNAEQVRRLKSFIKNGGNTEAKKPKAFVVKKAKAPEVEVEVKKIEPETIETPKAPTTKIENQKVEKPETNKTEQVEATKRPAIEVVKPQSRLEIVRRAPQKPVGQDGKPRTPLERRTFNNDGNDRKYPPRGPRGEQGDRPQYPRGEKRPYTPRDGQAPREGGYRGNNNQGGQRPYTPRPAGQPYSPRPTGQPYTPRPAGQPYKTNNRPQQGTGGDANGFKKPIQRHIISQEGANTEGKALPRKRGPIDPKKKGKNFNSKKEEQERISLEKAAAQKHKKRTQREEIEEVTKIVVNKAMTISELSVKILKSPAEIVKFLMLQGTMATVNQLIDVDIIKKICAEYELEVLDEDLDAFLEEEMEKEQKNKVLSEVDKKLLKRRAPVVSIMGHVDHGKTTLLDSIRASKHKIVATEVGGITQSIGAYTVFLEEDAPEKKIVFVDTPGHEAFTEMRARGAKATDIAILVVAADDGIMPQTIEAINHAKAAEVPIIVAVNKIDKPGANPDKILQQLTEHGLLSEEWGGDTITVKVSALQGIGIDELLEYILLVADMEDLKANPKAEASGVVIEANLDKGKGPVATLLVQNGTLRVGNCIVVGNCCGRVRALLSDSGERIQKAEPSTPIEILGLTEVPQAGDYFEVVQNEKEMKSIVDKRKEKERSKRLGAMLPAHIRREAVAGDEDIPQLNLIIKANTHGSAEAVTQAIAGVESKLIKTKIIHVGVGNISEADVMLASASKALILGFTVKEDNKAIVAAEKESVTIKKFDIIYQILEDVEKTMLALLEPETKEVELGKAEIRQVFTIGKTTKIAGCYVTEGKIVRSKDAVLYRDGVEIFRGAIDQLKRFKDDVKEVAQGFECGISFAKFNDLQEGDIIEVSTTEQVERKSLG